MRLEFLLTINRGEDMPDIEVDVTGEFFPPADASPFTGPILAEFFVESAIVHGTTDAIDLTSRELAHAKAKATEVYNEGLKYQRMI